jgi:Mce-associated membrane protein
LLVGVVVAAALGFSAFVGWQLKQLDDTAAAGRAALEAARNYAVTLTTLDFKNIDKNYQQVLDGATGEFKDQYSQGATQLRQVLIDNNATGKGIVIDAAVKSATKTKAEVLLFVDQSITNAVNPSPRIDRNRIQMTMELVDNRWLASKVEIL